jgi:thiol-disulfide isomerase/thioredoxin
MRAGLLALLSLSLSAQPAHFTMQRPKAPDLSLSQYRGKIVAVAFISTECPHCQDLTRILTPLAREYAPRGVQFVECAFNEGADRLLKDFIDRFAPPFPVGYSSPAVVRTYLHYSLLDAKFFVPHMQFLDRSGVVRLDIPGEADFFKTPEASIRTQLEKMLKPSARGAAK